MTVCSLRAAIAVALLTTACGAQVAGPQRPSIPLGLMHMADALATGTAGAGCTWTDRPGPGWRLSMADDAAAVRYGGRLVLLSPDRGAADLAPFTHDAWRGGGLTVRVRPAGGGVARGEAVSRPAVLAVDAGGRRSSWRGVLTCGT